MQFDIIIIGGGMVGAAMVCTLRNSQFKVALIDAAPLCASEDHRLIALNYSSICALKNLNIWNSLESHGSAIHEVHVSHKGRFGTTRLNKKDAKLPFLGYVVPAKHINAALYDHLDNITLLRPATLKHITQDADQVSVLLETPKGETTLTAKIIIGADGTFSTVRKSLNIPIEKVDYGQTALVTTTQLSRPHHHIAYERFQKQGAIAMLPLPDNRVATIWTGDTAFISQLLQMSDTEFLEILQKQFGTRLGRLESTSARYSYPLQMIQAAQKVKQRVILLGNAAHTLHPIAAQGLNLAFFEIAALTDYFNVHSLDAISLHDFATEQQKTSTRLSHHLLQIFSKDFFLANTLRQLGMIGLDVCDTAKNHFIQQSLGRKGKIPTLLREDEIHETCS